MVGLVEGNGVVLLLIGGGVVWVGLLVGICCWVVVLVDGIVFGLVGVCLLVGEVVGVVIGLVGWCWLLVWVIVRLMLVMRMVVVKVLVMVLRVDMRNFF